MESFGVPLGLKSQPKKSVFGRGKNKRQSREANVKLSDVQLGIQERGSVVLGFFF